MQGLCLICTLLACENEGVIYSIVFLATEKRKALSCLRTTEETTWEGLAASGAWSARQQQVSLAFLTFGGAMTAVMQDPRAMLCLLSSLWDATEGYYYFTSWAYLFVYGEGKEVFFFLPFARNFAACFFFILSYKKHKLAIQNPKRIRASGTEVPA